MRRAATTLVKKREGTKRPKREKMQKPLRVKEKKVTQKPLKVKEKRVMMPERVKAKKNLQRTQKLEMHRLKMQHPPKVLMLLMLMLQQWREQVGGQNSRLKLKHQKMEEQLLTQLLRN